MRKILVLAAASMLALALAACAGGSMGVDSDESGVHAEATNISGGSGTGNIVVSEGYGLCINHVVEKGTFHVKITAKDGTIVFDEDIKDNVADFVDVEPGEYDLFISGDEATGTIDVIPYDKEAQAMADATLDEALEEATGSSAEELGLDK